MGVEHALQRRGAGRFVRERQRIRNRVVVRRGQGLAEVRERPLETPHGLCERLQRDRGPGRLGLGHDGQSDDDHRPRRNAH